MISYQRVILDEEAICWAFVSMLVINLPHHTARHADRYVALASCVSSRSLAS